MLTLRYAGRQTRLILCPPFPAAAAAAVLYSTAAYPFAPSSPSTASNPPNGSVSNDGLIHYFQEWFLSRKKPLFDTVFEILRARDDDSSLDSALSQLNLTLSEALVLDALDYDRNDVLSSLKFFDWAGRQPGFHHTPATFTAIFRILSRGKLTEVMLEFLDNIKPVSFNKAMYYSVKVIGYALAGRYETSLQLFGAMRFSGVDLEPFAYHVLMNSLIEGCYFDEVETLGKEMRIRGIQDKVTHSIMMKSYCKQNRLERGEEYLSGLVKDNRGQLSGGTVAEFVGALCENESFERAALFIEELRKMGFGLMGRVYGAWIRNLVKAGKLDDALQFLKDKMAFEGYVPDVFLFNMLICRLLRKNRLKEVFYLLVEMKDREILPDDVTINASVCFLCKAGMMDIAMHLYDSRVDFGLSINYMAYNHLIRNLLADDSVDEAYRVLRNSMEQGYLPSKKIISITADAFCREEKLDKGKELLFFLLDQNVTPNSFTFDKLITALCKASRVEEGYLLHDLLNRLNKLSYGNTYVNLIRGFAKLSRGDIAARLLIEMQERGYYPCKGLVREVICGLCKMDNADKQLFGLLEMQMARNQLSTSRYYNFVILGAGQAGKPELAMQVHEMMRLNGLVRNMKSDILLLQSYLKNGKYAHALQIFRDISQKRRAAKLWHAVIISFCKAKKTDYASQLLEEMKANKLTPSMDCYEGLIMSYCGLGKYYKAVDLLNVMTRIGHPVSSFIGNVFLLHALKTRKLYDAWVSSSQNQDLTPASWMLGHLVGVFSGCVDGDYDEEDMENLIQQCFRMNIYTNNMLLRRLSMNGMDVACKFFERLRKKGYEPNKWSYDIIVNGLAKAGRNAEARIWMDEMLRKGFHPTEITQNIV